MVLIREDRKGREEDAASTLPTSRGEPGNSATTSWWRTATSPYTGADRTFYYTDIRYDMLDEATRQQIQQGLSFTDERTLYDFLENHSS